MGVNALIRIGTRSFAAYESTAARGSRLGAGQRFSLWSHFDVPQRGMSCGATGGVIGRPAEHRRKCGAQIGVAEDEAAFQRFRRNDLLSL
jgi:hypothetical protein